MVSLHYNGPIGSLLEDMGIGIDAFVVMPSASGPIVFAASGVDGGLICIGFDTAGAPQIVEQIYYPPSTAAYVEGRLELVDTPSGKVLLFGSDGSNDLVGIEVTALGFGNATVVSAQNIAGPTDTLVTQTANGFTFSASSDGTLRGYQQNGSGELIPAQVLQDDGYGRHR